MKTALIGLLVLVLILAGVWYEVSIWKECLSKNSVAYCVRTL